MAETTQIKVDVTDAIVKTVFHGEVVGIQVTWTFPVCNILGGIFHVIAITYVATISIREFDHYL